MAGMAHAVDDRPRYSLRQLFVVVTVIGIIVLPIYRGCAAYNQWLATDEEMERLQPGMTKAQVRAILGEPHFRNYDDTDWTYEDSLRTSDPRSLEFDENGRYVDWSY